MLAQSVFDWLREVNDGPGPEPMVLLRRLGIALLVGWITALLYRVTQGRRDDYRPGFAVTLAMLTIILALITQIIGNNIARAFSLVGSLAVVRFRTPVNDTRDTAFVILAVAVGMAVGTGMNEIALAGVPVVGLAVLVMPYLGLGGEQNTVYRLFVRVASDRDPDAIVAGPLARYARKVRRDCHESAQKGASIDVTFSIRLIDEASSAALVRELLAVDGVLEVELRRRR